MKNTLRSAALSLSLLLGLSACKKDEAAPPDIVYEKLGDVGVNSLNGFTSTGDPLASNAVGEALRWNSAASQWERIPNLLPDGTRVVVLADDGAGTYYGSVANAGTYVRPAGGSAWQPLPLPDTDTPLHYPYDAPFVNASGTVVQQSRRQTSTGIRVRVYRKSSPTAPWTRLLDRPADFMDIVQLADNGDVFFRLQSRGAPTLFVLKANATALVPFVDCAGTTVLPYCGFQAEVSPAGGVVFHQGGTGSRQLYRVAAGASYPATATALFNLPNGTANFVDFAALDNGTCLGMANDGGYGTYHLYVRSPTAPDWTKAPDVPGTGYVYVRTNRQGQSFASSRQSAGGQGSVYRIKY